MNDIARVTLAIPQQPASAEPLIFNTIALNLYPELITKGTQRVTFTTCSSVVDDDMIRRTINGVEGHEFNYALKTVPRQLNHPVRVKINNIIKERYGKA
jgi:hypothetical protein